MYYDYSKNLRTILNAQSRQMSLISSIPQKNLETLIKSANISSQILSTYNKSLLNYGYTNVINNTNIQDVLKLNIPSFFKNNNFQKNLFSDVALNKFVYSTRIPKNEILKMNYAFRNFNINITTTPTFTESINSSDPVNVKDQDKACNVSGRMFNMKHVQTSSKKYLNLKMARVNVDTAIRPLI
ncbi:hypothetical protein [Mammaliicoccus sciuri]|uniref:hypothetical protein n=1 Tax=Mammaliicoccus sciuri TaxID=1296 RepID=UPI0021D286C7|nr:hypothetical protein [Mammaliicoccus sciuri]UXV31716.1 hypothetical protein MUA60_12330 [Mammaliicoccus sciuri]